MSIADKLTAIAENEQKVYDAGKQSEYDRFWDAAQQFGNRENYQFAFSASMWTQETFKPKYQIKPSRMDNAFSYWGLGRTTNETKSNPIDLRFLDIDLSNCTNVSNAFYANQFVTAFGVFDATSMKALNEEISLASLFSSANNLRIIEKMIVSEMVTFKNTFQNCDKLEMIEFYGTIGADFDIHWSTKLSEASGFSIIDALSTTASGFSVTLPIAWKERYIEKRGQEAFDIMIAAHSNWTILFL